MSVSGRVWFFLEKNRPSRPLLLAICFASKKTQTHKLPQINQLPPPKKKETLAFSWQVVSPSKPRCCGTNVGKYTTLLETNISTEKSSSQATFISEICDRSLLGDIFPRSPWILWELPTPHHYQPPWRLRHVSQSSRRQICGPAIPMGFRWLRVSPWEIKREIPPLLGDVFGNDFIRLVTYGTKESALRNWKLESDFRCRMSIGSIFVVPILSKMFVWGDNSTNMEEKWKAEGISRWKQKGIILKLLILWRFSSQPSKINHHIPLDHLAMYQESHPWSFNHKHNWAAHRQGYSVTSLHTGNGAPKTKTSWSQQKKPPTLLSVCRWAEVISVKEAGRPVEEMNMDGFVTSAVFNVQPWQNDIPLLTIMDKD